MEGTQFKKMPIKRDYLYGKIMLTDRCNLKCKHCYNNSGEKNNEMEFSSVKKIVDEMHEIAGDNCRISLMGGEALLYSKLIEAIRYIKSKGVMCSVVTNGYLTINDKIAKRLKDAKLDGVSVSIDGPQKFHDFIRNKKGAHKAAINSIEIFKKHNIRTTISVPVFNNTINFLDYLQKLSERFNSPLRFLRFLEVGRGKDLPDKMVDKEGCKKLFNFCRKNNHMLQDPFFNMNKKENKTGCVCGVNIFYIITDGTLWPCWRMQIPLGNIKIQSLSEILMNPIIKDYQDRDRLKGKCGICKYKNVCGGCRAVPYVLYGDYHGEDPQCPCFVKLALSS